MCALDACAARADVRAIVCTLGELATVRRTCLPSVTALDASTYNVDASCAAAKVISRRCMRASRRKPCADTNMSRGRLSCVAGSATGCIAS